MCIIQVENVIIIICPSSGNINTFIILSILKGERIIYDWIQEGINHSSTIFYCFPGAHTSAISIQYRREKIHVLLLVWRMKDMNKTFMFHLKEPIRFIEIPFPPFFSNVLRTWYQKKAQNLNNNKFKRAFLSNLKSDRILEKIPSFLKMAVIDTLNTISEFPLQSQKQPLFPTFLVTHTYSIILAPPFIHPFSFFFFNVQY